MEIPCEIFHEFSCEILHVIFMLSGQRGQHTWIVLAVDRRSIIKGAKIASGRSHRLCARVWPIRVKGCSDFSVKKIPMSNSDVLLFTRIRMQH